MEKTDNPFIARLRQWVSLDREDEVWLRGAIARTRRMRPNQELKAQGEEPKSVHVVLDGLACRYKMLPDGNRQIVAFMVPGDPCDFHVCLLEQMDHCIATLSNCLIAVIPCDQIEQALQERPNIARAFWYSSLVDEAILREWIVNIGRRDAYGRVAHLLWELYARHVQAGLNDNGSFSLPLTQADLGDALGLSKVHINRTLQRLKAEGLITRNGRMLHILQPERLQQAAEFDEAYLHIVSDEEPSPERVRA